MELAVVLDRVSPVPLYHQLARQLRDGIGSGALPKGSYLGNEIALAETWQVSRPTVRRAIQDLVDEGLLVRRRGVGTQVVNDEVRRPFTLSSLHDDLMRSGVTIDTQVLSIECVTPPADIAESLQLEADQLVTHIVRIRRVDGRRLVVLRNWVITEVSNDITKDDLESAGLYSLLRDRGVRPHFARQRLGAKAVAEVDAELLGLEIGAPVLTMRRAMQDDSGRLVEVGDHVYDAAHYSIEMAVVDN